MLIDINVDLPGPSSTTRRPLPPQLVQFGTEELVLIELQGALEVDGNKDGQLVGKLRVDPNTVSIIDACLSSHGAQGASGRLTHSPSLCI